MKIDMKYVKIVSVPLVFIVALLVVFCGGGVDEGNDSGGDVTIPSIFTNFDLSRVHDLAIDASGGKWFGTDSDGVIYLDDNDTPTEKADDTWTTFTTADGLAKNLVLAVGIDASGGKWFETYGGGVSYLNDKGTSNDKTDDTWTTFTEFDGLVHNYVRVIAIDASGGKWFGTTSYGVSYLDDKGTPADKTDDSWTSFSKADGLADQYVDAIAIDASGGKWFGTGEGVSYLDDKKTPTDKTDDTWTTFTTSDGLAERVCPAIAIDALGGKWFGTGGGGVSYLNDNGTPTDKTDDIWTTFSTDDGLLGNVVYAIAIDASGGKWFGTGSASYLDDNGTPADKTDDSWTTFTYDDGLKNGGSIAIDVSGGKWFGGAEGVSYCP